MFNFFSNKKHIKNQDEDLKQTVLTESVFSTKEQNIEKTQEQKSFSRSTLMENHFVHQPINSLSYDTMMKFYKKNPLLQKVISTTARNIASKNIELIKDDKSINEHPLLELLAQPNAYQDGYSLRENLVSHLLLYGNAYLEIDIDMDSGLPQGLFVVDPRDINIHWNSITKEPQKYIIQNGQGHMRTIAATCKKNQSSRILHLRLFNPANNWFGLSPVESLYTSLQLYDLIAEQNISSIKNLASPSGLLKIKKDFLNETEMVQLREEFQQFMGPKNANGTIMLLQGDFEWQPIKQDADVDFSKGREIIAEEIAAVYGMPDVMIHSRNSGSNNYAQARLHWIKEVVNPMSSRIIDALQNWIRKFYPDLEQRGKLIYTESKQELATDIKEVDVVTLL